MVSKDRRELNITLLDTVEEEGEGVKASMEIEKVKSNNIENVTSAENGVMGPPLFPPLRRESRTYSDYRRGSTPSSTASSSDQSIDEFGFQPFLPDGQYSLISARYHAQLSIDKSSHKYLGKLASDIQSRSFNKQSESNNVRIIPSKSSKALSKALQLLPVDFYNANIGTSRLKEVQMPDFESFRSIKNSRKAICDQPKKPVTKISLEVLDTPQSRRHKALKMWWENRAERQNEREIEARKRGAFCSKACQATRKPEDQSMDQSEIREKFVPYVPNKFFEPPTMAPNTQQTETDRERERMIIRSRLIWEALQDGLVTLDAIISLPLDWGELCMEHYQSIGLLLPLNQPQRSALFKYTCDS